ncbi:MAG: pyridoxal phosphate-dependent aminotransferase [Alphaproteobacteria bacterium]|nr:pyridoxal phosphate-dependent aminotransferase [Alphaproteobacteria bacterium]
MNRFSANDIISLTEETPRYDLAESVGPDLRLSDLTGEQDKEALEDLLLGYRTAPGDISLREEIARLHGVSAEDVVITVGALHALFLTAYALCRPGDEAVLRTPVFPLEQGALESMGVSVRELRGAFDDGYRIDLDRFATLLSPATKLVSLATPQNPTGVAIPEETVDAILRLMEERAPDARLLLDATYREATYRDAPCAPAYVDRSSRVVSTASLSKCHGAPGVRLGWAVTRDRALRDQIMLGKFHTVISLSAIDEFLALKVLQNRARILNDRRQRLGDGLDACAHWVEANAELVEWIRPDAGAFCAVRLRPERFGEAEVAAFYDALAQKGVRVGDGAWFGAERRLFRLGFGYPPIEDVEAALEIMADVLRACAQSQVDIARSA